MANLKDLIVSGSARILGNLYATLKGNADTATKLETPRTIRTNLASTSAPGFDGTTNITPGVTGTLPVANGGTGQTSVANIQAGKDADGNVISTTYAKNSDLNSYVPNTRTVNGKALSSNITLTASDVSALSSSTGINDLTTTAQQNALNSGITSSLVTQIGTNQTNISTINGKIPSAATTSNQLADKSFVNSSISSNTADFIGTFNSVAALEAYSGTLTNNDYAFVVSVDSAGNTVYNRYKYNGTEWLFEYALNNSSFTSDQWATINSGATITNIGQIATNTGNISTLQSTKADDSVVVKLTGEQNITGTKSFNTAPRFRNDLTNSLTLTANEEQGLLNVSQNTDGIVDGASIVRVVKYNANGENKRFVAYRAGFRKTDDSGNNWPGIFVGVDTDGKKFGQFDTDKVFAPTPSTTTSTSDTYIATTGWTNTRLANYSLDNSVVHNTGNETISGSKIFNAEIKGTLITYQCHNGGTGGFYRKMGEIVLTGSYQSAVVPFYYYKDSTNCTETGYTGKISLRVDGTAGVVGATNTGVVLGEYPDWINDGRAAFYILYKNNTPETNKATLEVWTYVKNAWDGFKIIPLSYHGYGQSGWTWYNNPNGVTELPSEYTVINQKFARMYITAPNEDTTTSKQLDTVGARNTKLNSYALDNSVVKLTGNQSVDGVKTFTSGTIISKSAPGYALKATNITRATPPSSNQSSFMLVETDNNNKNVGGIYRIYNSDSSGSLSLLCYKPQTTDATYQQIKIGYDASGNCYTYAPTPSTTTSTSDNNIATTGWVNTVGNNVVHRNGTEDIDGIKSFTNSYIQIKNNSISYTDTSKSQNGQNYINFWATDKQTGYINSYLRSATQTTTSIAAYFNDGTTTNITELRLGANKNGTKWATIVTPTEDTNSSTQIDTVGARNTKLSNYQLKATYDSTNEMLVLS